MVRKASLFQNRWIFRQIQTRGKLFNNKKSVLQHWGFSFRDVAIFQNLHFVIMSKFSNHRKEHILALLVANPSLFTGAKNWASLSKLPELLSGSWVVWHWDCLGFKIYPFAALSTMLHVQIYTILYIMLVAKGCQALSHVTTLFTFWYIHCEVETTLFRWNVNPGVSLWKLAV